MNSQLSTPNLAWGGLESLPGLRGIPSVWRRRLGEHLSSFRPFLQARPERAAGFFCERCGCIHEVVSQAPELLAALTAGMTPTGVTSDKYRSSVAADVSRRTISEEKLAPTHVGGYCLDGSLVAVCTCDLWNCPDLELSPAELVVLEWNWARFSRALCRAFGLDSKFVELNLWQTCQIGSWSADAVPVILTIQSERNEFRRVVAELVARLRRPFILLAPTSRHLDATATELLANVKAGFFALDSHVLLAEHGALRAAKTPGELFAQFNPEPSELQDQNVARQAFALLEKLDAECPARPPTPLTIFRLYCIEELSTTQICRRCHCSKSTVINRLKLIRAATGMEPDELRRVSAHFSKIEDDLRDSRAEHIHRKRLIYDDDGGDAEE